MCWLFVTTSVWMIDLILLNLKYQSFTGGFLQEHQITGTLNVTLFSVAAWMLNGLFYGVMFLSGYLVARKLRFNFFIHLYHVVWLTLGGSLMLIMLRYKLHSYFGDFLTFSIIKNLGGGSIFDAITYAAQEGGLLVMVLVTAILLWWFGIGLLKRIPNVMMYYIGTYRHYVTIWIVAIIGTISLTILLDTNETYRHHLNKTTAFLNTKSFIQLMFDYDNRSYPLDIPDNGIDEDGLAGDLHLIPNNGTTYKFKEQKRHIVLIVLESVRGDVLDESLNGLVVTPNLNRIAKEGMSLKNYYSHSGYTTSSLEAIFTSYPAPVGGKPLLLEVLKNNDYRISIISGQDESFGGISQRIGSRKNANYYFDASTIPEKRAFFATSPGGLVVSNEIVVSQFKSAIETGSLEKPNFFYVNLQSAHFPYYYQGMPLILTQHPISRGDIKSSNSSHVKTTYLNAVAAADFSVGEIVNELKRKNIYKDTVLVIVGDHGESLFEDGLLGHGMRISEDQLNAIFVANRQISIKHPIGHASLGTVLLQMAGCDTDFTDETRADFVFHFVGSLDKPTYISGTFHDHQRLIYRLHDQRYQIVDASGATTTRSVVDVAKNAELQERFNRLFSMWATLRWTAHANRRDSSQLSVGDK
ncbi:MAG: hypothetical protein RLZ81_438 [Pseudomonadota bacterium]|jgi:glucan phosphoethanolaminetransferase (alkaline phosphatase superfamily)